MLGHRRCRSQPLVPPERSLPSRFPIALPATTLVFTRLPPSNPISVKGGSGTSAALSTTWNARALEYAGIAVVDAANVAITHNTSGNSRGNSAQVFENFATPVSGEGLAAFS